MLRIPITCDSARSADIWVKTANRRGDAARITNKSLAGRQKVYTNSFIVIPSSYLSSSQYSISNCLNRLDSENNTATSSFFFVHAPPVIFKGISRASRKTRLLCRERPEASQWKTAFEQTLSYRQDSIAATYLLGLGGVGTDASRAGLEEAAEERVEEGVEDNLGATVSC